MSGKRTNHCSTQLVALSTIGWYYIPKIAAEDFIKYWYVGKLERNVSFLIKTLHSILILYKYEFTAHIKDTSYHLDTKF